MSRNIKPPVLSAHVQGCNLKPVSMEDGEKAIEELARMRGKSVEEMREKMQEIHQKF